MKTHLSSQQTIHFPPLSVDDVTLYVEELDARVGDIIRGHCFEVNATAPARKHVRSVVLGIEASCEAVEAEQHA